MKLANLSTKAIILFSCTAATVVVGMFLGLGLMLKGRGLYRVLKIFEMEGDSCVERVEAGILEAYEGMNLENGDIVNVGDKSYIRIALDGDKYVLLSEGTVMELVAEGSSQDSRTSLKLLQGEILCEITNALSENSTYEVNTPKATMAVRGTSFSIRVTPFEDGNYVTEVCTYHGRVETTLYDQAGNAKAGGVFVGEDSAVTIFTKPNDSTQNAADVDGEAYYVFREADGGYTPCGKDEDPVQKADYSLVSPLILERVVRTRDEGDMEINDSVIERIIGEDDEFVAEGEPASENSGEMGMPGAAVTEPSATESGETTLPFMETEASPAPSVEVTPTATPRTTAKPKATAKPTAAATPKATAKPKVTAVPPITQPEATAIPTITPGAVIVPTTAPGTTVAPPAVQTGSSEEDDEEPGETGGALTDAGESPASSATTVPRPTETAAPTATPTARPTATPAPKPTATPTPRPTVTPTLAPTATPTATPTPVPTATPTPTAVPKATPVPESFKVTFEADDVIVAEREVTDGEGVRYLPEVPLKKGHTGQWVYDGAEFTAVTAVMGNITVTAQYTPIECVVTFELSVEGQLKEVETIPETIRCSYGSTIFIPAIPKLVGYEAGSFWEWWHYNWELEGLEVDQYEEGSAVTVEDDMNLVAAYKGRYCTVTFRDVKGSMIDEKVVYYGNSVEVPAAPSAPNNTYYGDFKGWKPNDGSSGEYIEKDMKEVNIFSEDDVSYTADFVKLMPVVFWIDTEDYHNNARVSFEVGHACPTKDDIPQTLIDALWEDDDANGRKRAVITIGAIGMPGDDKETLNEAAWEILKSDSGSGQSVQIEVLCSYD